MITTFAVLAALQIVSHTRSAVGRVNVCKASVDESCTSPCEVSRPTYPVIRASEVTITSEAPKARPHAENVSTWHCGAPRPLDSDYRATVRVCEWVHS